MLKIIPRLNMETDDMKASRSARKIVNGKSFLKVESSRKKIIAEHKLSPYSKAVFTVPLIMKLYGSPTKPL
tara:strand:+ start:688 stop:900 length:213 start_codon:yes stop_codon:yes gene_type:complete